MQLNYKRDKYLSEFSIKTLEDRYLVGGEKSPQDAFARAAKTFQMMKIMLKGYMTMRVNYGLCFLLQFFLMEELVEDYQLVVFFF